MAALQYKEKNSYTQDIQARFDKTTESSQVQEAVLFVENTTGDFSVSFGYGGRSINSPMIAASITKLFTTTCIIKLYEQDRLKLNDRISLYIKDEILDGLHIIKGNDYSRDLTISDLLFQTSGLPDYFEKLVKDTVLREDKYFTFEQYIGEIKKLKPIFAPNTGNRAYYSDINFDLLGEILEKITGLPLAAIYKDYIFIPLGMNNTYLPVSENDFVPYVIYKSNKLERPKFIASCRASGGCVSSARDLMIFSKAFWSGKLFDKKIFEELSNFKNLQADMGPVKYGGGYMMISLGGFNTMFMADGELLGHSGSTGSFLFYYPQKDLHFVGDLAQFAKPSLPIRFVMQLAIAVN